MELTEVIAYGSVLISEQKKVYLHNRFIRSEWVRFFSLSIRTSTKIGKEKMEPWTETFGSVTLKNKINKQKKENTKKKPNHKDDKKKGMKLKILLIFTFSVLHQVLLGFFVCFGLVWGFCLFYFISCVSSPPSKHQARSCNEIFQLDDGSYFWSESNSNAPHKRIWQLGFWCEPLHKNKSPSPPTKKWESKTRKNNKQTKYI